MRNFIFIFGFLFLIPPLSPSWAGSGCSKIEVNERPRLSGQSSTLPPTPHLSQADQEIDLASAHWCPLHGLAWFSDDGQKVQNLLDSGANPDALDPYGHTALHFAVIQSHTQIVKVLLRNNASVNPKDALKRTPLHYAAINGDLELVRILLRYGARSHVPDMFAWTPRDWALHFQHSEIADLLKPAGSIWGRHK